MAPPGQERPHASDDQLSRRAIAAFYRSPATSGQAPSRSDVREQDGKRYVVLSAAGRVLAVYRVRNDGMLKGLKRWPAELRATPAMTGDRASEECSTGG